MITVKNISYILIILVSFLSCSIKDDEVEEDSSVENIERIDTTDSNGVDLDPQTRDTDWDGIRDVLEVSVGRDPFIGNFPAVGVDNFDFFDLKVISRGNGGRILKSVRYKDEDNKLYSLKYNPIQDKMAYNSYVNVTNQGKGSELNERDLGVFKISNFNENQRAQLNHFLKSLKDIREEVFVYIDSKFRIKLNHMKGISKIEKIRAELGFINKKGQFENLTSGEFSLEDEDGFDVEVRSTGKHEEGVSSSPAFIHREYLVTELLEKVFEDNLDIAIKVKDYKVTLLDGQTFNFEYQAQMAKNNSVLYAIHTPDKDLLFFNSSGETSAITINKMIGDLETKGERIVSAGGFRNTATSSRTEFDLGSNDQLKEASWDIFPRTYLDFVPNIGKTVMIGYFSNYEIAVGGERLISRVASGFYSNIPLHCEDNENCVEEARGRGVANLETRTERLSHVRIGENIKITISGVTQTPFIKSHKYRWIGGQYVYEFCDCESSGADGKCDDGRAPHCREKSDKITCNYDFGTLHYDSRDLVNAELDEFLDTIHFVSEKQGRIFSYDKDFFNLYKPVTRKFTDEHDWIVEIRVTQEFLDKYGESITLKFPRNKKNDLTYGFIDWGPEGMCSTAVDNSWGYYLLGGNSVATWVNNNQKFISDEAERGYKINIERIFKK